MPCDDMLNVWRTFRFQILNLKMKHDGQLHLLKQKQKSDEAATRLKDEIHSIKAHKVSLTSSI